VPVFPVIYDRVRLFHRRWKWDKLFQRFHPLGSGLGLILGFHSRGNKIRIGLLLTVASGAASRSFTPNSKDEMICRLLRFELVPGLSETNRFEMLACALVLLHTLLNRRDLRIVVQNLGLDDGL
jgi:hypothetical protein